MELILQIKVYLGDQISVTGRKAEVNMISFTGEAYGRYFNGKVIGTGVDTQKNKEGEGLSLSARYMLAGKDYTGDSCRIFIENNGSDPEHCIPCIVTDSKSLSSLESAKLKSKVTGFDGGVLVSIYETESKN